VKTCGISQLDLQLNVSNKKRVPIMENIRPKEAIRELLWEPNEGGACETRTPAVSRGHHLMH
jgi:hypothetical protein